jgi:hypothetical protein
VFGNKLFTNCSGPRRSCHTLANTRQLAGCSTQRPLGLDGVLLWPQQEPRSGIVLRAGRNEILFYANAVATEVTHWGSASDVSSRPKRL